LGCGVVQPGNASNLKRSGPIHPSSASLQVYIPFG
jgi:hypothetical protein